MIKLTDILFEGKLSKPQIKKMRDNFKKTGKLPPHLKKLADLMDKEKKVKDIVIPGLEWMADIKEEKLSEAKETLVATGKDKRGKKIEMFKTVRWGGMVTHILKSNGKEFDQYAPNLKDKVALNKFKKDYKNIKIEKS